MDTSARRILLVEDDQDDIEIFQEIIQELDKNVDLSVATDGIECLDLIKNGAPRFHLIFLDINLPRVDGMACLKHIRANEHYKQVPVILLSTAYDQKTIATARALGATEYVGKTWQFDQLKVSIGGVVDKYLYEV